MKTNHELNKLYELEKVTSTLINLLIIRGNPAGSSSWPNGAQLLEEPFLFVSVSGKTVKHEEIKQWPVIKKIFQKI